MAETWPGTRGLRSLSPSRPLARTNERASEGRDRADATLLLYGEEGALQVRKVRIDIASDSLGRATCPCEQPLAARDRAKIK